MKKTLFLSLFFSLIAKISLCADTTYVQVILVDTLISSERYGDLSYHNGRIVNDNIEVLMKVRKSVEERIFDGLQYDIQLLDFIEAKHNGEPNPNRPLKKSLYKLTWVPLNETNFKLINTIYKI